MSRNRGADALDPTRVNVAWGISSCSLRSSPDERIASSGRDLECRELESQTPWRNLISALQPGRGVCGSDGAPYITDMPIARLHSRALVRISGPDWRSFLQGLLTQDVETLAEHEARFAALLTPQGKLLFDLFVVGTSDGALLDVAADRRDALIQKLAVYRTP